MKTGEDVWLEAGECKVRATISLASPNEKSLMLEFDAIFLGYVGMMPVSMDDDGKYRDLIEDREVSISPIPR